MRVVLRPLEPRDVDPYVAWMDPSHDWHRTNAPYLPIPTFDDAAIERLRRRAANPPPELPERLVVALYTTGEMIGTVNRYWESIETDWLAIGLVVYDPLHRGRGLGTEALGLWTTHLFAEMPRLVRLGLRTWSGNIGMIEVALRLGFVEEARFRRARIVDGTYYDSLGFGVLREEWDARYPGGFGSGARVG